MTSSNDFLHFLVNLVRGSRGIMYDLVLVQAVPYYKFAFKGVLYADVKEPQRTSIACNSKLLRIP